MPVKVRFLDGIKKIELHQAYAWVNQSNYTFPSNPIMPTILKNFLENWDQIFEVNQQANFLENLSVYIEQVELFNGICDLGEKIIREYPPQVYLYVGVGRSPAPLIAYFENQKTRALSIPLSDFRPRNIGWSITDEILVKYSGQGQPRLTAANQALVFAHFKRYFPTRPIRNRILLLDYTQSAQSLISAQEQLQNFFLNDHNLKDIEVHALAICRDSDARNVRAIANIIGAPRKILRPIDWLIYTNARKKFAQRWHVLPIVSEIGQGTFRQNLVMSALGGQRFDALADFGSFKILNGQNDLVRYRGDPLFPAAYDALREELRNARVVSKVDLNNQS
jgi:hypothetical protein